MGNKLNPLRMIHAAMIIVQLLIGTVFYILKSNEETAVDSGEITVIFTYLIPVFVLASFMISNVLFNNRVKIIREIEEKEDRIKPYISASIIKFALLEFPSLFSLVAYFITGKILFLLIAFAVILYFLVNRPTEMKTKMDIDI